jgi:hypothetical protein
MCSVSQAEWSDCFKVNYGQFIGFEFEVFLPGPTRPDGTGIRRGMKKIYSWKDKQALYASAADISVAAQVVHYCLRRSYLWNG